MCIRKNDGGMGFRDLKCFNQALLAKQLWRLHEQPTSLLATTLKAKYYKNSDVLDARRGFDPSFSWRSLWGAKPLLLEGLIWRVGNGWNIRATKDKWITKDGQLSGPPGTDATTENLMVGDLIDHEQMQWQVDKLHTFFDHSTVEAILSIPLPREACADRLFWKETRTGLYSVKSGYWLAMTAHNQRTSNQDEDTEHVIWRRIWNLNVPPKLKHFLWRACRGSLPVNVFRKYRHMTDSDLCPRCNEVPESLCHALLDCKTVGTMWTTHPCNRIITEAPRDSFTVMIKWFISHASAEDFEWICASMWASWFSRNKMVMEAVECDVLQLSISFVEMVKEYKVYSQKLGIKQPTCIPSLQKWQAPRLDWVKINFDAHINTGCRRGLGIVIRNHRGELLLTGTRIHHANWSVEVSEAAAALYGLEVARRMGYQKVHLEGDALSVITAIEHKAKGLTPLHFIYDSITNISVSFLGFVCNHVCRGGNTVAHLVARADTDSHYEKICMTPFPHGIQTMADLDLI